MFFFFFLKTKAIRVEENYSPFRALALGNANAKCKENLAFATLKTLASENCKQQYYKKK